MYLNPEHMTGEQQRRIVAWLEANGCRDVIALEPIIVRGKIAEYQSAGRRLKVFERRWDGKPGGLNMERVGPLEWDRKVVTRTRRLRLRIPLARIPRRTDLG